MGKFKSTDRKGFHITFENGLTVSVQWGGGNYCENHDNMDFSRTKDMESKDAEVAVWSNERWLNANNFLSVRVKNYPADKIGELKPTICM